MELLPLFLEVFYYLCNVLYSYYCSILLLFSRSDHPHHHVQSYSEGDEGYDVDKYLVSLDDAKFTGLGSNYGVRIAGWDLSRTVSPFQYEGIVTKVPQRDVVDRESIQQGKGYSGIFKLESYFELPNGRKYMMKGTAFAVSKFYALTSAHLMWHRKLGPAKSAVLIPDRRQHRCAERVKQCVAVACHANPIKSRRRQEKYADNDFCVIALKEPFDTGVRNLVCHKKPGPSSSEDGLIIGFPKDMPDNSSGEHLIWSKGSVFYYEREDVLSIEHKINTVEGNSGSPVIVSDQVVGIHSMFLEDKKRNAAAPVNRNGNKIEEFLGVLRYMRTQHPKLPEGVIELEEARGVTHPGRVLRLFA